MVDTVFAIVLDQLRAGTTDEAQATSIVADIVASHNPNYFFGAARKKLDERVGDIVATYVAGSVTEAEAIRAFVDFTHAAATRRMS